MKNVKSEKRGQSIAPLQEGFYLNKVEQINPNQNMNNF